MTMANLGSPLCLHNHLLLKQNLRLELTIQEVTARGCDEIIASESETDYGLSVRPVMHSTRSTPRHHTNFYHLPVSLDWYCGLYLSSLDKQNGKRV